MELVQATSLGRKRIFEPLPFLTSLKAGGCQKISSKTLGPSASQRRWREGFSPRARFESPAAKSLPGDRESIEFNPTYRTPSRAMTSNHRSSVIRTRVASETRARFSALAAFHGLCEAHLLARMVNEVLKGSSTAEPDGPEREETSAADVEDSALPRVALRLRTGDRALATLRADACGMKLSSYLVLLVRNHVRRSAVPPPCELTQLKILCAHLASLRRQLEAFGTPNTSFGVATELGGVLAEVRSQVEAAREEAAAVVRRNLICWETGAQA